jgi:hypothetical protein
MIIMILSSCNYNYKVCNCNSADEEVKIYNDILTELVENHFYNRYLGKDEEEIFNEYIADKPDTAKIKKREIQLQNKLFNDTARFCNIYLDTIYRPYFNKWTYYQNDTSRYARETKDLISSFSTDGQSVIDSLNNMKLGLKPNDFQLCTSKVLSIKDLQTQKEKCYIGVVSFSRLFLNKTKTKGLLYCNFRCGGLCGKGNLLIIEKVDNRWIIKEARMTWVS